MKKILFTLILMASCFGILGVGEKGEAASCSDTFCIIGSTKCYDAKVLCVLKAQPGGELLGSEFRLKGTAEKYQLICMGNVYNAVCVKIIGGGCDNQCCKDWKGSDYKCVNNVCKKASTVPQLPSNADVTPATPTSSITVREPTSTTSGSTVNLPKKPLSKILEDLIKWLLQIVILIAILMIIVSGAMYMISAGDQQKADTAKKALTYAILGLLVVALAYAIVNTLVDILT